MAEPTEFFELARGRGAELLRTAWLAADAVSRLLAS